MDIEMKLVLVDKTTQEGYYVISGRILSAEEAKANDITSSFLTLENKATGEQKLAMYHYFADNEYELSGQEPYVSVGAKDVQYDIQEKQITDEMLAGAIRQAEAQVEDRVSYMAPQTNEDGPRIVSNGEGATKYTASEEKQ
jgi:hypothetical protein